jgi:dGTPase
VAQSEEIGAAMLSLRTFMFERVYLGPRSDDEHARAGASVQAIFDYLIANPAELPGHVGDDHVQRVTDFIAGMTDRYALAYAARIG